MTPTLQEIMRADPVAESSDALVRRLRELANDGAELDQHASELAKLAKKCGMTTSAIRRTYKEIRKAVPLLDEASHEKMDAAFSDRSGDLAKQFSVFEDKRTLLDNTAIAYPSAFPNHRPWRMPEPHPKEQMFDAGLLVSRPPRPQLDDDKTPPFDFTKLQLSGQPIYAIARAGHRLLGHVQRGPLVFQVGGVAEKYVENEVKLCVHRATMTAESIEYVVNWFRESPKYLGEVAIEDMVDDGEYLYEILPELKTLSRNEPQPAPDLTVPHEKDVF